MQAEPHVGVLRWIGRIVCCAGCGLGIAFVLAVLAPGSDTAHAAGDAAPVGSTGRHAGEDAVEALWADPGAVSAAAARRAAAADAPALGSVPRHPAGPASAPERSSERSPIGVPASPAMASTPLGSLGGWTGTPDAGPSMTQVAVLAAALLAVRWLAQRLLTGEVSWRSALVVSGVERPG